jgi:hypothetical protein
VTKRTRPGLQPVLLTIPDHWTPENALAVFKMIDALRDIIWAKYGFVIQDALRCQLEPDRIGDNTPTLPHEI